MFVLNRFPLLTNLCTMLFSITSALSFLACLALTSATPHPRNNDAMSTNTTCSPTAPLPYDHSAFNHPEFLHNLPRPSFEFLFHLQCDLGEVYPIGDGPFGNRKAITFTGGRFEGPKIKGDILYVPPFRLFVRALIGSLGRPGGADWLLTTSNGTVSMPDTRYNLRTDDGAYIYIQTRGTRTGPKEVLDRLTTDPTITADQYR